ncbi:Mobilization protein BmgA [Mucinivorans hirudinis]|uniref:Mobilization protein BmgA n=1 Tax=Mucinivorans hirudinis TaxID=1433126 RepID=A0A060REI0_9BACT|nr:Mobilization protein BmgA [Mucinivorans hirudinis]
MNRIDFNGKRISDQNERFRSTKICKEITIKHGLYVSSGKENVKRKQLREPNATKYRIYDALCKHVPQSRSWGELRSRLRTEGVELGFKTKGSTDQIEGVRFTMNNLSFNGSKVDRQFSYSKIDCALRRNAREQQSITPTLYTPSTPTHSAVEQVSNAFGGLFDMPILPNGTDPEEEAFRKRMQRKKKKGIRF